MAQSLSKADTTSLYILGLLSRLGELHGYRLKKILAGQVADFARIKTPTLYYHLDRLGKAGLVARRSEQEGRRPERSVYTITDDGRDALRDLLGRALRSVDHLEFGVDAVLYFAEQTHRPTMIEGLRERARTASEALASLEAHRDEVREQLPPLVWFYAGALFEHHLVHLRAEIDWLESTIASLEASEETR